MIKLLINTIIIAFLCALAQTFLPWWSVAAVAFIVGYFSATSGFQAFASGFLALFVLWGGYALFIDLGNEHILSSKVAQIFKLTSPYLMILITAIIGGLVAGFASLTGVLLKGLLR